MLLVKGSTIDEYAIPTRLRVIAASSLCIIHVESLSDDCRLLTVNDRFVGRFRVWRVPVLIGVCDLFCSRGPVLALSSVLVRGQVRYCFKALEVTRLNSNVQLLFVAESS